MDGDGAGSGRGQRQARRGAGGAREGAERREGNWVRAKREVDSVRYDRAAETVAATATAAAAETRIKKGREGRRAVCAFVVFKAAATAAARLTPRHFLTVAPIVVAGGALSVRVKCPASAFHVRLRVLAFFCSVRRWRYRLLP